MPTFKGEVWINGIRGITAFFDAADEGEAARIIASKGEEATRNPAPGVKFKLRTTIALAEG